MNLIEDKSSEDNIIDVQIIKDEAEQETSVPLIFQSIVELVLGVFLVVYRDRTSDILFIVIGALMICYGLFELISFLTNKKPYSLRQGLASGVLTSIIGISFIVQSHKLTELLGIVLGALVIIECIINCRRSFMIKKMSFEKWYIPFIASLVIMTAGVLICIFPDLFGELVSFILGIFIILVGLLDLWAMLTILRLRKK